MTITDLEPTSAQAPAATQVAAPCPDPWPRWFLAPVAAVCMLAAFVQSPGLIVDDSKLPVIMSPLAWMRGALHLWAPSTASGAVTPQAFGYLFPMGPFFALTHALGIPVWCAERMWFGLLLTVGAWGVIRLAEAMGIGHRGARVLAAVAYCTAPIVVDWTALSIYLLAVVFLPWVLRPLVVGAREGSPRRAAMRSGVAIVFMGGVNATVILAALPLPALWLLTRERGPRRRALMGWWVVAVFLACFWWIGCTLLQGKYGYNYLPFTETATITTSTSSLFESLRGTTNWQNYYDIGGPLVPGGWTLVTSGLVIGATAVSTALGLVGLIRRIPERLFLVTGLTLGVVVMAIGYQGSLGGPFAARAVSLLSGGLGPFRNVSKFSPLVTLPLALGLAWVVSTFSLGRLRTKWLPSVSERALRVAVAIVAVVVVVVGAAPFWQRDLYPPGGFSAIPAYWHRTADWLTAHQDHQTTLVVPGAAFADYTWGEPQDEPLSLYTSTSVNERNIVPIGSNGNTEMLSAVQNALDTGTPQPGLAAFLARSGINYLVERNDLNLRATGAHAPAEVHQVLHETPGLVEVASFGPVLPAHQVTQGPLPMYDSSSSTRLRAVEIYRVEPATSEVQTYAAADPLVVSGDVGSVLPVVGSGVANGRAVVLSKDPDRGPAATAHDATWVMTDGNQRKVTAFGHIDNNQTYLLSLGQPTQVVPGTLLTYVPLGSSASQTVAAPIGAVSVNASSYGSNPLVNAPTEGPMAAFDGNPGTAWVTDSAANSLHQWLSITLPRPVDLRSIHITPLAGSNRPELETLAIMTDRGTVHRHLPATGSAVSLTVAPGPTRNLKITIAAVYPPAHKAATPIGAGIVDVSIPGLTIHPAMQLPTDELSTFAADGRPDPVVVLEDAVSNPSFDFAQPLASPPLYDRRFTLPHAESAEVTGTATPVPSSALTAAAAQLRGATAPVRATASSTLRSLPRFSAQNLVDGSSVPWIAAATDRHPVVTLGWPGTRSVGSLTIGQSSVTSTPTRLALTAAGGTRTVAVPATGGTVTFEPLETDSLSIRVVASGARFGSVPSGQQVVGLPPPSPVRLPVGLASIAVPALATAPEPAAAPSTAVTLACGSGPALTVDGTTVPTSLTGTVGDLAALRPLALRSCASTALRLAAGPHVVSFPAAAAFRVTSAEIRSPSARVTPAGAARAARIVSWSTAHRRVALSAGPATYLQVAQTFNRGWHATLGGRTLAAVSLDGWEQGWIVPAGASGTVTMTFVPDHTFQLALTFGALLLLVLLVLALVRGRSDVAPVGPLRRVHWVVLATVAAVAVVCVGGLAAVLLVPLVWAARRWGAGLLAAVSGLSYLLAGLVVANHPNKFPFARSLHTGAFGPPAQGLALLALCALLSAVVVEDGRWPLASRRRTASERA